jgi:VWFA-related protein
MKAFSTLAALLLAASLSPATPARAQQAPASDQPLFGEEIDVRVVNVEVVVTDKAGNRVDGLQPGDFRLKVDGKTVPIEYFTEVRGGQAIAPEHQADAGPVPGLPSIAPGSPVGTSYLVFIDDYFSVGKRRDEVLNSLRDDLTRLGPDDRMAIVAFDGRKLDMLSTWSNSERDLRRALEQATTRPSYGFQRLSELRSFQTSRNVTGNFAGTLNTRAAFANRLDLDELGFIQTLGDQERRSVEGAVSALRGFASPPGRKVMILLDGGWPFSPADYALNDPNRPVLDNNVPRGEQIFRLLVDTANLLGYTLYTVDVPGVDNNGPDASDAGPRDVGLNLREQEVHAALEYVARETGGEALINGRRSQALPAAASDTRSYYWIGFTPKRQGNDMTHKVEVAVERAGLKARSRDSYLDLSRRTESSMMVESAMMFGSPPGSARLPIQLGKPESKSRKEMELPISIAIPVSMLTLVPLEGKQVAQLELRIAALDDRGNRSPVPVIPITLKSDTVPPANGYVKYDTKVRLRKAPQHLVVAIFDPLSGNIATAETDVKP